MQEQLNRILKKGHLRKLHRVIFSNSQPLRAEVFRYTDQAFIAHEPSIRPLSPINGIKYFWWLINIQQSFANQQWKILFKKLILHGELHRNIANNFE